MQNKKYYGTLKKPIHAKRSHVANKPNSKTPTKHKPPKNRKPNKTNTIPQPRTISKSPNNHKHTRTKPTTKHPRKPTNTREIHTRTTPNHPLERTRTLQTTTSINIHTKQRKKPLGTNNENPKKN